MGEERRPVVSIVTPVYNVEKFILETVECVRAQTFTDWELLLVEDRGTDGTYDLLKDYLERVGDDRIRLFRMEQNSGAACARNQGVREARLFGCG